MYVNHSGWNEKTGAFSYDIYLDENKTDYALVLKNGEVLKQTSHFQDVTADWNNDGDVYTCFGAWFESSYGGNNFWSAEDLVFAALEAQEEDRRFSAHDVVAVRGLALPAKERRPSLDAQILKSEQRALNQDADRNRRMKELGIRGPGEPWAR